MSKTTAPVRTRLAPSPSKADDDKRSSVHLGNVRTGLFAYLFAKQNNGTFLLRIEDSDQNRVADDGADNILADLKWLGLNPDEGYKTGGDNAPYTQMEYLNGYKAVAEKLIDEGKAYKCYCTQEELDALRAKATKDNPKAQWKYPESCRDRKDQPQNNNYSIRFKSTKEGITTLNDNVFGKITFPNKENYDFVILRASGVPLYNFGCVVDDIRHNINWVIRGRDHIINYVPQALLYEALKHSIPNMAHLPMILNQSGAKLSKRDGAVTVDEYRKLGYSPEGILNYIARLGFSSGNKELFSLEELVKLFTFDNCGKNDAKFDPKKFSAIQQEHLKSSQLTSNKTFAKLTLPFLQEKNINPTFEKLEKSISLVRDRSKTLLDAVNYFDTLLMDDFVFDEKANSVITNANLYFVPNIISIINSIDDWNETTIKETIVSWGKENNLTLKDFGGVLRLFLSGKTNSPELFQMIYFLGKDKSIERLNKYTQFISAKVA